MIHDDKKIEFTYEKVIHEPNDEDSGTTMELFVKFRELEDIGPTVSFTEEMDVKKRDSSEWTHLPLDFFVELTEYLHQKGHIEKINWIGEKTGKSSGSLAKPTVSRGVRNSIGVPRVSERPPQPSMPSYTAPMPGYNPQGQGFNPQMGGPQVSQTPDGRGFQVENSRPPYQLPEPNLPTNPFGNNVAPQPPYYQAPNIDPQHQYPHNPQPQQYPQYPQHPQQNPYAQQPSPNAPPIQTFSQVDQGQGDLRPQPLGQQADRSQGDDLTAMLNSEVGETPAYMKEGMPEMVQQRAAALHKQISGEVQGKIKPIGNVRESV